MEQQLATYRMYKNFAIQSHGPDLDTFLPKKSQSKINPFAVATMNLGSGEAHSKWDSKEPNCKITQLQFQFWFATQCLPVNAEYLVETSVIRDVSASKKKSDFCDCAEKEPGWIHQTRTRNRRRRHSDIEKPTYTLAAPSVIMLWRLAQADSIHQGSSLKA